ncbi:MAG: Gfo/Idh/MocA family oxidoreductase [Phycisphaerales bacterium]|nr:Gfo/Idh/MocA family oxidoreductase [Phycisphaerales bacterium]
MQGKRTLKPRDGNPGPIKTAVIGLGRAGWNMHVESLRKRTDYQLVACVDGEADRRREAESLGAKTFATFDEFLKAPQGAELVVIATSTDTHCDMSIRSLNAGLHVLVEKPMTATLEEAQRLVAAAKQASTLLTIHHNWRCNPEFRQLQSIVTSGILGRVFLIKMIWNKFRRRNDWQTLSRYGGGLMNVGCSHSIDLALQLLEAPVKDVWADLQQVICPGDTEDHAKLLIRGENERVIDLESTFACIAPQSKYTVMGTLGSAWLQDDEFIIKYLEPGSLKPLATQETLAATGREYGAPGDVLHWQEKRLPRAPESMALDFYSELWQSIRRGKELLVKPDHALEQIRVGMLAKKGTRFK